MMEKQTRMKFSQRIPLDDTPLTASRDGIPHQYGAVIESAELDRGPEISRGKYGTVYRATCRGQNVAVKVFHKDVSTQIENNHKLEELKREVDILSCLRHPSILTLMGVCYDEDRLSIVMELVRGKSLDSIIRNRNVNITMQQALYIARGISQACTWLHCLNPPIIHRDIKPENIMVNSNFEVKIIDFGLSVIKEYTSEEIIETETNGPKKVVGTPKYMAPEVWLGSVPNEKSDIYAFGLVLWEIFTRPAKGPYSEYKTFKEFTTCVVRKQARPAIPDSLPPALSDLIEACWHPIPDERPSFSVILTAIMDMAVTILVKDKNGRAMWNTLQKDEEVATGGHYPFSVPWERFRKSLVRFLRKLQADAMPQNEGAEQQQEQKKIKPDKKGYQCLQLILGIQNTDLTASKSNQIVTCDKFGAFLDVFGPLNVTTINDFRAVCEKGFFHGNLTSEEAESRLSGRGLKRGAYLVRLSSKDGCVTISRLRKDGAVTHTRIQKKKEGFCYPQKNLSKTLAFTNLLEFVEGLKDELILKEPCVVDNPYASIFGLQKKVASNYHFNELDDEHDVEVVVSSSPKSSSSVPSSPSPLRKQRKKSDGKEC